VKANGAKGTAVITPSLFRCSRQRTDRPVLGDGDTDDTAAIQRVIDLYAGTSNVIYIDAGSYILTDTIKIPPGAKIVGELWAQLVARVS
jgi:polygalacturonase